MTGSPDLSNTFTQATDTFIQVFSGYTHQLMGWGTWLFVSLAAINLGWLALGYAFEKDLPASMLDFIKRFFIMMFFYTLMSNPDWLLAIAGSFTQMGQQLTGIPVDPSAIIENGIMISDRVTQSMTGNSLWHDLYGALIVAVVNITIMFAFFSIGIRLACTLIINTALVVVSAFFLGFAGLGATGDIARSCLTTILANCARLLGIYLVVGAGAGAVNKIAQNIPSTFSGSFDAYLELAAISLLLWWLAKELPEQFARLVSHNLSDVRSVDALAIGMAVSRTAQSVQPAIKAASTVASSVMRTGGSMGANAAAHFRANSAEGIGSAALKAVAGVAVDTAKHGVGTVGDHIRQAATKLAGGGNPIDGSMPPVPSFSSRMHQSAQSTLKRSGSEKD